MGSVAECFDGIDTIGNKDNRCGGEVSHIILKGVYACDQCAIINEEGRGG